MRIKELILLLLFSFIVSTNYAQQDSLTIATETVITQEAVDEDYYDPLAPAQAAFYSAVLPGLGQAYNESYWKIPIVYAGLGVGIYFYSSNQKQYHRYRDAYKRRIAGYTDDEFIHENGTFLISTEGLIEAQKMYQRNKEISILVTLGIYILNIVDANVDAHLRQFNVSEDLSLNPSHQFNEIDGSNSFGLSLNYNF